MCRITNIPLLEQMIAERYITKVKHPVLDLYILNYSQSCVLDQKWNEVTNICRGLIVDENYTIIQRPFPKFFNYEEIKDKSEIPDEPFEVYEKLDGSLGILYWDENGLPAIATRGSFSSEQALHATNVLRTRYPDALKKVRKDLTYLFEIIYPENHIVINYGDMDDITLLAVIDTENGRDIPLEHFKTLGFPLVTRFDGVEDFTKVREIFDGTNKEGFVIKFKSGYRLKLKFAEYFRIHALLSHISEKILLEMRMFEPIGVYRYNLGTIRKNLDEENRMMVDGFLKDIKKRCREMETRAKKIFKSAGEFPSGKEAYAYFSQFRDLSPILMCMFNKKPYMHIIRKKVREALKERPVE